MKYIAAIWALFWTFPLMIVWGVFLCLLWIAYGKREGVQLLEELVSGLKD